MQIRRFTLSYFAIFVVCALINWINVLVFGVETIQQIDPMVNLWLNVTDVTREGSVTNWLSATLLFLTALVCLGLYCDSPTKLRRHRFFWSFAFIFFGFLSLDEAIGFHERVSYIAEMLESRSSAITMQKSYFWQYSLMPVYALAYSMIVLHLFINASRRCFWSVVFASGFLAAGTGLDYFEGLYWRLPGADGFLHSSFTLWQSYYLLLLEESLEFIGLCIIFFSIGCEWTTNFTSSRA